jgi:hypothetical protein
LVWGCSKTLFSWEHSSSPTTSCCEPCFNQHDLFIYQWIPRVCWSLGGTLLRGCWIILRNHTAHYGWYCRSDNPISIHWYWSTTPSSYGVWSTYSSHTGCWLSLITWHPWFYVSFRRGHIGSHGFHRKSKGWGATLIILSSFRTNKSWHDELQSRTVGIF